MFAFLFTSVSVILDFTISLLGFLTCISLGKGDFTRYLSFSNNTA